MSNSARPAATATGGDDGDTMQPTTLMAARRGSFSLLASGGSRLVWKAYALALQTHMTTQDDLDNSSKAIFVAAPGLYDIPAGEVAPQEITNARLFRRADPLQDTRSPFYSDDGYSYFDTRRKYLENIHDDAVNHSDVCGSISKLRSDVQQAQDRTAEAYLRNLDLYHKSIAIAGSGLASFEAWADKFGVYYAWAKSEQDRLEGEHKLASARTSSSVGLAVAAFDLAQDTSTLRLWSNMPCADMEIPSSMGHAQSPFVVPPEKVYYRPLYSINGVDRRVDSWVDARDGGREEVRLDLDIAGAKKTPWVNLGFPNLDTDPSYDTNLDSPDVKLSLKAGGLQAFDVDRGFWDVSAAARSQLGSVAGIEPRSSRLMKITRILLGYRVEIRITDTHGLKTVVPDALLSSDGGEKSILGMHTGQCTVDEDDGEVVVASAPSGFPAVLAVLGREI